MNINEFVEKTSTKERFIFRPCIWCNDGFNMSVQASSTHYCSPRESTNKYTAMETGYPSEYEADIIEYAEDLDNPTDTVYGYVPIEVIHDIIEKHGGIDVEKTFNNK